MHELDKLTDVERVEDRDPTAREHGSVQLERRVLGRRTEQDDVTPLHIGQKRVLLGPVEAVDLVDEQQGSLTL